MKKRLALLLITFAMIISGCQNKEKESEIVVPSTTEHPVEEKSENPSEESVQKEEKSNEDAGTGEEVADVKNEEEKNNEDVGTGEEVADVKNETYRPWIFGNKIFGQIKRAVKQADKLSGVKNTLKLDIKG